MSCFLRRPKMNQPALRPRITAATTAIPSPAFIPVVNPLGAGVRLAGVGIVDPGTGVVSLIPVLAVLGWVVEVIVEVLVGELSWVDPVEVIFEVLALVSGLTVSLAVMLK